MYQYSTFATKNQSMAFRKLSMTELERQDEASFLSTTKKPVVVILDNIRSGLNIGSIFRTSDAFAIESIAICGISVQPPHKEILKTALGSTSAVAWQYFATTVAAIAYFKGHGYTILAVEQATPRSFLQDYQFDLKHNKYVCVFGNEVDGVSDEALALCDGLLEIPQYGTKHSLNVAVSAGIILYEMSKK
jgi:23S rRNA (guanosine2251-2'-O)-methyltransferase